MLLIRSCKCVYLLIINAFGSAPDEKYMTRVA